MLFNSLAFLIFGLLFFLIWPVIRRNLKLGWIFLTIASFIFYGWWDWRFIFLIIFSGLIDYFAALGMRRFPAKKKFLLIASIIGNVGSLAVFKYLLFFSTSFNHVLSTFGYQLPLIQLTLPVGISFYTFQSMSYTIDVYRDQMEPTHNIFHFFAYLSMFPQLVAGPIVRAAHLMPQLTEIKPITEEDRWEGLKLITYGYFKKVVMADNLAQAVNIAFASSNPEQSAIYWWIVTSMFAFQIYFDFSGYSDIARGLGRWMGFNFPLNFNHPYISKSLREFWQRWHISLSTWFRDYVYIPMGGSKKGLGKGLFYLWITMLIAGLWHGASWTFVIWGALFALYISVERITSWSKRLQSVPFGSVLSWIFVIIQVWVAWVFFRAETLDQAVSIVSIMFNPALFTMPDFPQPFVPALFVLIPAILSELFFFMKLDQKLGESNIIVKAAQPVFVSIMLVGCIFLRGPGSAFIYFQF